MYQALRLISHHCRGGQGPQAENWGDQDGEEERSPVVNAIVLFMITTAVGYRCAQRPERETETRPRARYYLPLWSLQSSAGAVLSAQDSPAALLAQEVDQKVGSGE